VFVEDARIRALFIGQLNSPLVFLRRLASSALINSRDEASVNALLQALQDHDPQVRFKVIKGLGYCQERRAFHPLLKLLVDQTQLVVVRQLGAEALGHLQDRRAVDPLVEVVRSSLEPATLRRVASIALASFTDPQTFSKLRQLVQSTNEPASTRVFLLYPLSYNQEVAQVLEVLSPLLNDREESLVLEVVQALRRISHPRALELLKHFRGQSQPLLEDTLSKAQAVYPLSVYADHYTLYLVDAELGLEGMFNLTEGSFAEGLETAPGVICIISAKYDYVPVELALFEQDPGTADFVYYDQIAETYLEMPSGKILVGNVFNLGEASTIIRLPAGGYQVRVYYGGLASAAFDNPAGNDFYRIALWPGEGRGLKLVRKYNHPKAEEYQRERGW
jgi:hypothetical protein